MMKMKLERISNSWCLSIGQRFFVQTYNEWIQLWGLFRGVNFHWLNITPIQIMFEKDIMVPGYELEVFLLGIGLRFRWNSKNAEKKLRHWHNEVEEMLSERKEARDDA